MACVIFVFLFHYATLTQCLLTADCRYKKQMHRGYAGVEREPTFLMIMSMDGMYKAAQQGV